ncbi:hypothetical protein RclHR1_02090014 [Rhizophagus clarus]|uniref:Uncharacterized protein n=1 Tax=Rhizophagus clarus TaxID=94130 RepID=A0A2Z6QSC6_9GLOM|nr:hypothetical protein RclHR1_02090014 [Rhizophagus clarus]GES87711.1 hypothetical protein RCL_jg26589.t1 [Rhizophagus clarus]
MSSSDIDYKKTVFDLYFFQAFSFISALLIAKSSKAFDDIVICLSILLPTIIRFFLTSHPFWGFLIIVLGIIMIYFILEFYNYKVGKESGNKFLDCFKVPFVLLLQLRSIIPLFITLYVFYLPLAVEVYDKASMKLFSPFESPKNIHTFCLTKSDVVACEISYYIRLYILWLSLLVCIVDLILNFAILKYRLYVLMKSLSMLRLVWLCVITLLPGIVFGILLSDESQNYYVYKISTCLSISACIALLKHYLATDYDTYFSQYINTHRLFEMIIKTIDCLTNIENKLREYEGKPVKVQKVLDGKLDHQWVRCNIKKNDICFNEIFKDLKDKFAARHMIDTKIDSINSSVDKSNAKVLSKLKKIKKKFDKDVGKKLKNEIGLDLEENKTLEIIDDLKDICTGSDRRDLQQIIVDKDYKEEESNTFSGGIGTLENYVRNFFNKLESIEEGPQAELSIDEKEIIYKTFRNVSKFEGYRKKHEDFFKDLYKPRK